jgi:beta-galactosidase
MRRVYGVSRIERLAVVILGAIGTAVILASSAPAAGQRERLSMDNGWRFCLGDMEGYSSIPEGAKITKWRWKAEEKGEERAPEMAKPGIDTSGPDWRDAGPKQNVFKKPSGFVWFRTTLPDVPGPHRFIYFECVDDNGTIYFNGKKLMYHQGWNESFQVSLDEAWKEGGPNELAVLVENTDGPGGIWETVLASAGAKPKAGSAAAPDFDDKAWRVVDVPHDFVVEGRFDPKADGSHGFLPKGIAWYRRAFDLPAQDKGKRVWIEFDGIYRKSTIWLNGSELGSHQSGYTSFHFDVTDVANFGGRNVLAVRVDCTANEGWWYEGGGIYRHTWLTNLDPVHVGHWGTYVTTNVPDVGDGLKADAEVNVQTTLVNESGAQAVCTLKSEIQDTEGRTVATATAEQALAAGASADVTQKVKLPGASLWFIEKPYLYKLVSTVQKGGQNTDTYVTPFGVRTIRYDADKGFFLNGKSVKIKGACNHQDFAGVGVALPDRIHEYKIQKLKEMGANGYRCSHHPPAPEILDACDRLGMVVMDENRKLGDSPEILGQVESMLLRDRNHPSVVMWSLCNEEHLQGTEQGERMGKAMKEVITRLDTTRPVTAAMNGGWGAGLTNVCDLQGFNYHPNLFDGFHKDFPKKPVIGSESHSITTTRGIYITDGVRGYVSSYTDGAERSWLPVAEHPFVCGTFVWTGFDYRGEPSPYAWPCINSHFGIMDTCGFPKDDYYYYLSWWTDRPVLHILPHWNWAYRVGRDGKGPEIDVRVYSNCDRVELFHNGESQGAQDMKPNGHLQWKVKWVPGALTAKGWKGGKEVATAKVETTGAPAAIKLSPDRATIKADGEDVSLVTVSILDDKGRLVPVADDEVRFEASPNALIIGVGNGDPSCHEPDKATKRRAFNGLCMVIVQSKTEPGAIQLKATADGLESSTAVIQAEQCALRPAVPVP